MTFSRRGFTWGESLIRFSPLIAALARSGGRVKSAKHRRRRPALDPVSALCYSIGPRPIKRPQDAQPAPVRSCSRGLGGAAHNKYTGVCINTGIACWSTVRYCSRKGLGAHWNHRLIKLCFTFVLGSQIRTHR